ncbi:MAG: sortase [Ruminococcaceae bacterium]|nr:sortase [Oscillospiraceae bacterium]
MKNIYQDDFSSEIPVSDKAVSEKGTAPQKPVRPARHAPPPIKRSVITNKNDAPPEAGAQTVPYGQPGFYPQPVFYQPDANGQPVPVFYAPVAPQQFAPYTQPTVSPAAPQSEAATNDAGTRVLFQSADFDKKDDLPRQDGFGQSSFSGSIDLTEINLASKKRAPAPKGTEGSFRVDEMEIGTYEFNIMTAGQGAKAKSVLTPAEEAEQDALHEESYIDEIYEDSFEEEEEYDEQDTADEKAESKLPSREIIRRSVLAVAIVAIVIAAATLINEYRLHLQNKSLMQDMSELIITEPSTETTTQGNKKPDKGSDKEIPTTLPLQERPLSVEEQWEVLRQENPDITFPEGLQLKYAKLYAQNTDFVGYLKAEGSELDTPIVQGEDDEEYVEKNFYGESTKYACPFVTYTNKMLPLDGNTVIYGHRMRDGSIFGTLDQYKTLEGYKKAPVISFNTLYNDYNFKIIAAMITNIDPKDDNGYVFTYYWTNLNNELNTTAYLNQLSQRSLYDTGVDVLPTDKLLTLSTCCKDFENARFVIVARLVRPGESTEVDTSLAVENPNPRYPQAYYDEKGEENPFANAYKWEIS